jgi:uncharacterized protein YciI
MSDLFVVLRRYGFPHDPDKPLEGQLDWEEHRVFMNHLYARGIARMAGPLGDGRDEVLLVFRAESAAEIERELADDPWTRSGLLTTARIARWNLRLGEVG